MWRYLNNGTQDNEKQENGKKRLSKGGTGEGRKDMHLQKGHVKVLNTTTGEEPISLHVFSMASASGEEDIMKSVLVLGAVFLLSGRQEATDFFLNNFNPSEVLAADEDLSPRA